MKKFKKPDLITSLLLLFVVAIPLLVMIVTTTHKNIEFFSQSSNAVTHLKLLDKDFNYFIMKKGVFSNYDVINQKMDDFQKTLLLFQNITQINHYDKRYQRLIEGIKKDFQGKIDLIEHTKSYHSIILNSLNYLHDLKKSIQRYSLVSEEEFMLLDDTLFLSTQLYMNSANIYHDIEKNLQKIKLLSEARGDYLVYFYQHEKSILQTTMTMQKEYQKVLQLHIYHKLEILNGYLNEDFHGYLKMVNIIMIAVFGFAAMFLFSILYLYRKSLQQKKKLSAYKYAIENSDNSIIMTDINHLITYVNAAFTRETGYSEKEVLGKNPSFLSAKIGLGKDNQTLKETLQKEERWEGEFINRRKDGTIFYEKASIVPMVIDKNVTGYIAIKLNITEYIEQEKRVKFLAYHDTLTSLPNRFQFEYHFNHIIAKKEDKVALMYLDLDHFKTINDTLGHQVGDALLKVFAKRLRGVLAVEDFIARIGGDEFVVILQEDDHEKVSTIAQRMISSLKEPIFIQGNYLNMTTSIGIALFPKDGENLVRLLKHADTAMYAAKTKGRNQYQFFTQELSSTIYERLNIEQELRHALEKNELYMVYQPKYRLESKEIVGFEALIRWENEKLGFVPPDKFIPIAEEIGLIEDIGYFVFEKACRDFQLFSKIQSTLEHIAINVSTIQFKQEDFITRINALRQEVGLDPSAIELEVTESYIMENIEEHIAYLERLRAFGYNIAIDDFGTGYSSFSYLKRLPITTLKIDKSFVDDICVNKRDKDITNAIIALANNLGFATVAEGIEEHQQELLLQEMGCELGQGYFFSRPKKPSEIISFIQAKELELV